jgi:flagellar biosynthesis anti-sigma factor FlgM
MKIDGQTPRIDAAQINRPDKAGERASAASGPGGASASTDQVSLSPEAQLAQAATAAAEQAPAIRNDVVDRMRALLDQGQVGNDTEKLAGALIDHWLESNS